MCLLEGPVKKIKTDNSRKADQTSHLNIVLEYGIINIVYSKYHLVFIPVKATKGGFEGKGSVDAESPPHDDPGR